MDYQTAHKLDGISDRLRDIYADGRVTAEERAELDDMAQELQRILESPEDNAADLSDSERETLDGLQEDLAQAADGKGGKDGCHCSCGDEDQLSEIADGIDEVVKDDLPPDEGGASDQAERGRLAGELLNIAKESDDPGQKADLIKAAIELLSEPGQTAGSDHGSRTEGHDSHGDEHGGRTEVKDEHGRGHGADNDDGDHACGGADDKGDKSDEDMVALLNQLVTLIEDSKLDDATKNQLLDLTADLLADYTEGSDRGHREAA